MMKKKIVLLGKQSKAHIVIIGHAPCEPHTVDKLLAFLLLYSCMELHVHLHAHNYQP